MKTLSDVNHERLCRKSKAEKHSIVIDKSTDWENHLYKIM